jgi:ankyrin repeat protein
LPASAQNDDLAGRLAKAVQEQDCDSIRTLAAAGADLDATVGNGITLLQDSANDGRYDAVRTLLERGAQPDLKNPMGFTALHYAAYRANAPMVKLLLEFRAAPDVADNDAQTPLHIAAFAGSMPCVAALVAAGADILKADSRAHTAMDIAELRAAERLQFAQESFLAVASFLKEETQARTRALLAEEAQKDAVARNLARLKSLQGGLKLKVRGCIP